MSDTIKKYDEKFPLSEMFVSFQGEGKYQGRNALFVRFRGCNLRCSFCDTKVTWSTSKSNNPHTSKIMEDIVEMDNKFNFNTVVFTGGETMLHFDKIMDLLMTGTVFKNKQIAIETNGTVAGISSYLNETHVWYNKYYSIISNILFTISPKVFATMEENNDVDYITDFDRLYPLYECYEQGSDFTKTINSNKTKSRPRLLAELIKCGLTENIEMKFVVDAKELKSLDLVTRLMNLPMLDKLTPAKVYIQPMGTTQEAITCSKEVIDAIIARGYNFSPRLHILLGVF